MESFGVLLRGKKERRRFRKQLLLFTDALVLHLEAGYDLAYICPSVLSALEPRLDAVFLTSLSQDPTEGISSFLDRLGKEYPDLSHRVWFTVLRELYAQGAGLGEAMRAMASTLRREDARDLEQHCRELPGRLNLLLLLFFLPPTLLLLFVPLLQAMIRGFSD